MSQLVFIMYLSDVLDVITLVLGACVFFSGCAVLISLTGYCLSSWSRYDELNTGMEYSAWSGCMSRRDRRRYTLSCKYKAKFFDRAFKITLAIMIIATVARALIPKERTLYAYIGVEATQQIAQQVATNPRMEKIMKIVDAKLDEMVKETTKDGK